METRSFARRAPHPTAPVRAKFRSIVPAWAAPAAASILLLVAMAGRAAATVITAFPVDFATSEQANFNGAVATFEDDNPSAGPADFTATIDWGDGTGATAGTIGFDSGAFAVIGQHVYADEGAFTATVTIADVSPGTGSAKVADSATVTEADSLTGSGVTFAAPSGASFQANVANFTDTLTTATPADFVATINWGDATTSAGTVSGGGGTFHVGGAHTYASPGTYTVVVTLSDDAPGTATAQATSTAKVSAGLAVTATSFAVLEGHLYSGPVAAFSDSDTTKTATDFAATINWGDGSAASAGTVTGGLGSFNVAGMHTYDDEQSATFTVTVTEVTAPNRTASGTGTAIVGEADVLAGTPVVFAATAGVSFTGTVANFTDVDTANVPSDFSAVIDWGDGTTSAGTVTATGPGHFAVSGTHTYAASGTFTVQVTLNDDPPGTATATTASTANVTNNIVLVPTLGGFGLFALGLCLTAVALARLRRARA